ncbi:MAG: GspE/PulE family protein [Planctomycetota bacterium]
MPDLARARAHAENASLPLDEAIVDLGLLSSRDVALIRADIAETCFVDLDAYEPNLSNAMLVPQRLAEERVLFPLFHTGDVVTIAMHDPLDLDALDRVRELAGDQVDVVLCEQAPLRALIARAYALAMPDEAETAQIAGGADQQREEASGPVVTAVRQILEDAAAQGASDVHINPDDKELHVRFRVDGVLTSQPAPSKRLQAGIIQRLKVMGSLDLTQTRRPQDGKFRFKHGSQPIDVRMSVIPTIHGENVVLRLLARQTKITGFAELGMAREIAEATQSSLKSPYGLFLVTGPTGSGKTTTLYTALNSLNDPSRNIMTIEDPVEIRLRYVRQVQVQSEIGLTFAAALRSILRQDPDVVLVGEIRDDETARIACQAALTGHLVLSTLHTNDAPSAVTRLRDFGIPSFIVNSSLLGAIAQRLVRQIDPATSEPDPVPDAMRRLFGLDEETVAASGFRRAPTGATGRAGYAGRVGIHEMISATPAVREMIDREATTAEIRAAALGSGMRPMWLDGLDKAALGMTSLDEVARATPVTLFERETPGASHAGRVAA